MDNFSDDKIVNPELENIDYRIKAERATGEENPVMADSSGMTILLVDDHAHTVRALERLLMALGHEVLTAANGVEAWSLLQRHRVQVVLSDWMMPCMDGLELCRRVRDLTGQPYTYFLLLTGNGGDENRLEALAAGADDFMTKPFSKRELVARLAIAHRLLAVQDDLQRKNVVLREMATTDELTGLKNRRSFFEALELHFSLAGRQRSPLSLVLLDVDNFKGYNDLFGHPAGDNVLRGIADVLRSTTRAHDTVARHGGEEFTVLLPMTGPVVARAMAERLRKAIERRDWPHRHVTASFGVATMTLKTRKGLELVDQADSALYASKRHGRNRVTHQVDPSDSTDDGNGVTGDQKKFDASLSNGANPGTIAADVPPTGAYLLPSEEHTMPLHDDIVAGWSRAMVLRDRETASHSRRVTATTLDLARTLGIDEADMVHIRRGCQLHDIGKMGIPDAILQKPGPLSDEEWLIMRRHPGYAVELLAPFDFLNPALDIPRCHHERWDGTGYPHGLRGEEIPLAARAFAAVDIWDALSHDRPYREAWPQERVRAHITALAGTHLDPDVVAALDQTLGLDDCGLRHHSLGEADHAA
jgi:diguanylate cyclase (GGDEF)-like protein